jgi:diguanylate cyclase (GGDEF)-like protein
LIKAIMFQYVTDRFSLTLSMLLLTVTVGAGVWLVTDHYQSNLLHSEMTETLKQRFNENAMQQRVRFDQYVKSFNPGVRLYAKNIQLKRYVREASWKQGQEGLVKHQDVPEWAPSLSSMRQFVRPRYMLLIDEWGKVREIYHYKYPLPPRELVAVSPLVLELSIGQSYLTFFNDNLYLIASEHVTDEEGNHNATLLIASPIDQQFMLDSQGVFQDGSIIGLVRDDDNHVFVSSAPDKVATGTDIESLTKDYLVTDASYFDSGSADIIIRFFSLTSTRSLNEQIAKLVSIDRKVSMLSAIIFIASFSMIMLWITARIRKLSKKVVKFSNDIDLSLPDSSYKNELRELDNRFRLLANAVQSEKSALEYQASHDSLTDIPNRNYFEISLTKAINHSDREADRFALLICDLNKFKQVNDTYGHQVGDEVIKIASKRLVSCLRDNDIVARMGGDEFAVILKGVGVKEVETVASKIITHFQVPATVNDHRLEIGISIGASLYPVDGDDVDTLMNKADVAMYQAKHSQASFAFYRQEKSSGNGIPLH